MKIQLESDIFFVNASSHSANKRHRKEANGIKSLFTCGQVIKGVMSGYLGVNPLKRCSPSLRCSGYGPLDICTPMLDDGAIIQN